MKIDKTLLRIIKNSFKKTSSFKYPLLDNAFTEKDILAGTKVLLSRQLTMSKKTLEFEKKFAKYFDSKFAVMTNSGSSANLLAAAAICNPQYKNMLKNGDEIIIPSVCWSTSLWPFVLYGLKPRFVDIDINNLCISVESLKKNISKKTKAIVLVNILGQSPAMTDFMKIVKKNNLILIEDNCESLGSSYNKKYLGTYGDFGTFSFYYSHQITSGEGGMILCKKESDYNLLKILRAHGWSRDAKLGNSFYRKYKDIDKRFLFCNSGFNLRPTEVQAAIAESQLKNFTNVQKIRNNNRLQIINYTLSSIKFRNQISFVDSADQNLDPSWFGLPILINKRFVDKKEKYLSYLSKLGIENRPIVSGNFLRQPAIELHNLSKVKNSMTKANIVHDRGFFIGLHSTPISLKNLKFLSNSLLNIDEI